MKIQQYFAGDYAGLRMKDLEFYYGYEVTDFANQDLWCFTVHKNKKEIYRLNQTQIENGQDGSDLNEPKDYLLIGIVMWLTTETTNP